MTEKLMNLTVLISFIIVIVCLFLDTALVAVLYKYFFLLFYFYILLIIIDFIVDLFKKNKKQEDRISHNLWRIVILLINLVIIPLLTNSSTFFDRLKINFLDKNELNINEAISEIKHDIEAKYGIEVYCKTDVLSAINEKEYDANFSLKDEDVEHFMIMLDDELAKYTKKGLNNIPKKIILSKSISNDPNISATASGVNFNPSDIFANFILYSIYSDETTIHHEFFHSIATSLNLSTIKTFIDNNDLCKLTTDYACTNTTEHLAEAWAHSVADNKDNKLIKVLKNHYSDYLIGFNETPVNLSKEEIADRISTMLKEGDNHLTVKKINKGEIDYIETELIKKYPEITFANVLDVVSSNDKTVFYINRSTYNNLVKDVSVINQEIVSLSEIFNKYENLDKMKQIYLYVESMDDNEIPEVFLKQSIYSNNRFHNKNYEEGKNLYLNFLLRNNGFNIELERLKTNDNETIYINTVKINENKYALYPNAYKLLYTPGYGFLLSSDQIQRISGRNDVEFNVLQCNDDSLSIYKNVELVAGEYNEGQIKQHLINTLKKGIEGKIVVYYYDNHDDVYKTFQFLFSKDRNNINNFTKIYWENIGRRSPACRIITRYNYVLIYDLF